MNLHSLVSKTKPFQSWSLVRNSQRVFNQKQDRLGGYNSLWASNRNPAPPGGFLETTIFGSLSHRAIEIRLPAKIPVLDKAVRALFFKMAAKFQQISCFWYYFFVFRQLSFSLMKIITWAILCHNKK